jgi:hypothetical protein
MATATIALSWLSILTMAEDEGLMHPIHVDHVSRLQTNELFGLKGANSINSVSSTGNQSMEAGIATITLWQLCHIDDGSRLD